MFGRAPRLVFGELSCTTDTVTNLKSKHAQSATGHYSIGAVWFLIKNKEQRQGTYALRCKEAKLEKINITDRKAIIEYVTGDKATCELLDKSNVIPVTEKHAEVASSKRPADEARTDSAASTAIRAELGDQKIEELRKKRLARQSSQDMRPRARSSTKLRSRLKVEEIIKKEKVYETRTSVLRGAKPFKGVLEMLQASKKGEDRQKEAGRAAQKKEGERKYDRYDQPAAQAEGEEFGINEAGAFEPKKDESADPVKLKRQRPKKKSGTPIIIVSARPFKDGICLYNIREFLEDGKFRNPVEMQQSGIAKPQNVTVIRRKESAGTSAVVKFKVVDNTNGISADDWDRVVACFIKGEAWELKNWPMYKDKNAGPPGVFSKMKGFYIHFDDQKVHQNAQKWDVTVLKLSRHKRHLDKTMARRFWEVLDAYTAKYRTDLNL